MKTLLAASTSLALACCAAAPVPAVEFTLNAEGAATITLSAKETAACAKEGGCIVATREGVAFAIKTAIQNACGKEVKWQQISKKPLL